MNPANLFKSDGLITLARYIAPDTLFAFDLDGTLAPIVENYTDAQVEESVRATLEQLVKLAKVVVITGRSRKDAQAILGLEPHLLIGNHGAEWPDQDGERNWNQIGLCLKWQEQLYAMLGFSEGIEIEFKGESLSVHYRKSDNHETALSRINAAVKKLIPEAKIIGGKFVVNLLPATSLTKGQAIVAIMEQFGLKRVIYFGDDITDEAVFMLNDIDLLGIHIGHCDNTAAPYYLDKQSDLLKLLKSIVGLLEIHSEDAIITTANKYNNT